jgi:hypothetical protein
MQPTAAAPYDFNIHTFLPMLIETGRNCIHNRNLMKVWSRAVAVVTVIVLAGCAGEATLLHEDEYGGVVVYPYTAEQGPLLSSFRKDALAMMKKKCGGRRYVLLREGEAKGRTRVVTTIQGGEEAIQERRWGIQFQCK